jgi:RNA polymerase sigma factor (sigma-70 family)
MTPPPSVPDLPAAHDHRLSARSDDELVDLARTGDAAAYGELFARHRGIGTAIARRYFDVADPDDIVAESFARILATIKRGGGPRAGFRPYLITTIGNVARRWATRSKESASDELDHLVDPGTVDDPVVASTDRDFALEAFKSLPERWQAVLWYSAVEGMGPTEISGYLGMTPNATAVLAHRARAGLRTAWVQAHLNDATLPADCRATAGRLGRRATGSLNRREQDEVKAHLATCLACRSRARELDQVSARLASWLVPALLGLGLPLLDDGQGAVAATAVTPLAPAPAVAPAWITTMLGIGTAATFVGGLMLGAPTPVTPAAATVTSRAYDVAEDATAGDLAEDPAPAGTPSPLTAATGTDADVDAERSPVAPGAPAEPLIAVAPPAAPIMTTSIDPFALTPPALVGTGQPGARVLVTDETGAALAEVPVDASGTWSTGTLTTLSAAAAGLQLSQRDADNRRSPVVGVPLAARPLGGAVITPLAPDWHITGEQYTPLTLTLEGWPGATVALHHAASGDPREPLLPSSVVLDAAGHASVTVAQPWPGTHTVTARYVDAVRAASSTVTISVWVPWFPD